MPTKNDASERSYNEIVVDGIDEFVAHISKKVKAYPNENFIYRGQSQAKWELIPTVQRPLFEKREAGGDITLADTHIIRKRESDLLDEFKRRARPQLRNPPKQRYDWEWLAIAQHYRLPTRLLDWTSHAGTALFFALEDPEIEDEHSAVWCSQPPPEIDLGDPRGPIDIKEIRLFRPPHVTQRISLQNSCFTVHPADYLKKLHKWPTRLEKIMIRENKRAITLKVLKAMGINRATIFGDLDSIALEIKREYCEWI